MTSARASGGISTQRTEVAVVGGGHNGLVASCLLALHGRSVQLFEASEEIGGAAVSRRLFAGVDARVSKYSYLISLFPDSLMRELGVDIPRVARRISSYTPDPRDPARGLAVPGQGAANGRAEFAQRVARFTGATTDARSWDILTERIAAFAPPLFETLTRPLPPAQQIRRLLGEESWNDFVAQPLGAVLQRTFEDEVVRGIVLTDGLIGTFARSDDRSLRQNACFLYHVIGNGTGSWDLPMGGMGAVTDALAARARDLGVEIVTGARVVSAQSDGHRARLSVECGEHGRRQVEADVMLAGCAPTELTRLMGMAPRPINPMDEGAQIKVNMVLTRLPRLRDSHVDPQDAFGGTFHVNESVDQLDAAYDAAISGRLPELVPCEAYCHSLGDRSILGPSLAQTPAQTLTVFALQTPHRLFRGPTPVVTAERAQAAVLASLSSVLAEPIEDCLMRDANGAPCIQVSTTADLERELGLPAGNIFHTPLDMPFATTTAEEGSWGVETPWPNIAVCGSGARRGGGVSGIPGHNAARYALEFLARNASTR